MKKLFKITLIVIVLFISLMLIRYIYFLPHHIPKNELKNIELSYKLSNGKDHIDGNLYNKSNETLTEIVLRTPSSNPFLLGVRTLEREYIIPVYVKPKTVGSFHLKLFEPYSGSFKDFVRADGIVIVDVKTRRELRLMDYFLL